MRQPQYWPMEASIQPTGRLKRLRHDADVSLAEAELYSGPKSSAFPAPQRVNQSDNC